MTNNKNSIQANQTFETSAATSLVCSEHLCNEEIEQKVTADLIPMTNAHLTKTASNTSTLSLKASLITLPTSITEKAVLDECLPNQNVDSTLLYTEANRTNRKIKVQSNNCAKCSSNICFASPTPLSEIEPNRSLPEVKVNTRMSNTYTLDFLHSVGLQITGCPTMPRMRTIALPMYNTSNVPIGSNLNSQMSRANNYDFDTHFNYHAIENVGRHAANSYRKFIRCASSTIQSSSNQIVGGEQQLIQQNLSNLSYHQPAQLAVSSFLQKEVFNYENGAGNDITVNNRSVSTHTIDYKANNQQHSDSNQQYQGRQPILRFYKNNEFQQHQLSLSGNEFEEGSNHINAIRNLHQMECEQTYGIQHTQKSHDHIIGKKNTKNATVSKLHQQNQWESYNEHHAHFQYPNQQQLQEQQHIHNQNFYNLSYMSRNNHLTFSTDTAIVSQNEFEKSCTAASPAQIMTKNSNRQNHQSFRLNNHNSNRRRQSNSTFVPTQHLEIDTAVQSIKNCDSDCSSRKFKRTSNECNVVESATRGTMVCQEDKKIQESSHANSSLNPHTVIEASSKSNLMLSENENILSSQVCERTMCVCNETSAMSNASISPRVLESVDGTHLQHCSSSSTCSSISGDRYSKKKMYLKQDQENMSIESKSAQNMQQKSSNPQINLPHTISQEFLINAPSDRFLARAHLIEVKEHPTHLLNNSKWDNLSRDIWTKFVNYQQTEKTFRLKMKLWRDLYILIKKSYPRYGLYLVGSTISGFGADTSDADMCLISRTSGVTDTRTEALVNLIGLRDCLIKSGYFEEFNLIEAKVPILRFRDRRNKLEVDLNYNNSVGIKNTHLLYCYSQLDWRLRPLTLVVKLWAQYHNINNAKNMTISSYSLVLMVIHFLQYAVNPPVLPCLHTIFPEKFTLLSANDVCHVDLNENMSGTYESRNSQTLGELFLSFLDYYSRFNYSRSAISVRTGAVLPIHLCRQVKSSKNDLHHWKELCIEEPFDLTNTARSVYDFETFERVKTVFSASWKVLQSSLNLMDVFTPGTCLRASYVEIPPELAASDVCKNEENKEVVENNQTKSATDYENINCLEAESDVASSNCEIIST